MLTVQFQLRAGLLGIVGVLAASAVGCKDNAVPEAYVPVVPDGAVGFNACVDDDGDGYGDFCSFGLDCDDDDAQVTDGCFRCQSGVVETCPCQPGTAPAACVPPPYRGTDANGVAGTYRCSEGTRYCAEGVWGACQALAAYVFDPD